MRIVYMGSPASAISPLQYLLNQGASAGFEVCAVVSQPAKLVGRGRQKLPSDPPVAAFAKEAGLSVLQPAKASDPQFLETLAGLAPDVVVTCAYGQILSAAFLAIPRRATINIHPSRLPKFRGAVPVPATLLAGDTTTAITILFTVRALDAGNIILQRDVAIEPQETAAELLERLCSLAGPLLLEALEKLRAEPDFAGLPQDEAAVTHCRKIDKDEGRIDWQRPRRELSLRFRAFYPWPGSFTYLAGKRLVLDSLELPAVVGEPAGNDASAPGSFYFAKPAGVLMVKAGDGWLAISRLTPAGSRCLAAANFWNGLREKEGLRFDSELA